MWGSETVKTTGFYKKRIEVLLSVPACQPAHNHTLTINSIELHDDIFSMILRLDPVTNEIEVASALGVSCLNTIQNAQC